VPAVKAAAGCVDIGPPAAGNEADRRVIRQAPPATTVQLAQQLDGGEHGLTVGVRSKLQRGEHARGEVPGLAVAVAELFEMGVLERALDLLGELERELQLLRVARSQIGAPAGRGAWGQGAPRARAPGLSG